LIPERGRKRVDELFTILTCISVIAGRLSLPLADDRGAYGPNAGAFDGRKTEGDLMSVAEFLGSIAWAAVPALLKTKFDQVRL
jgi:hypothetical protein